MIMNINQNLKGKRVHIRWDDARLISSAQPTAKLSPMETAGTVVDVTDVFVIVSKPRTIRVLERTKHPPGKQPTFYIIPRGMIRKIRHAY